LYHPGQLFSASNEKNRKKNKNKTTNFTLINILCTRFCHPPPGQKKEAKGKGKNTKENPDTKSTNKIAHISMCCLFDDGRGFQGVVGGRGRRIRHATLQFREPNFTATWWLAAAARSNWLWWHLLLTP
jgi:hypothetical protein